jgi:hypothetical protein
MYLSQTNQSFNHKITSGSEYQWQCFPNARFLDYESLYAHVGVIYNTETTEIYQADVSVKRDAWEEDKKPYRWTNPSYKDVYLNEAKQRNIDPDEAWDDIKWTELEVSEDWLEKATAIFNGEEFDTRVQVPIDLDNDTMFKLFMEAHKRDITLNKMVEIVLQEAINSHRVNESLV